MYKLKLHKNLTVEKWRGFAEEQQVIMILNEVQRVIFGLKNNVPWETLQESMERALELVDLTVEVQEKSSFRKELLRWRGLLAEMYIKKNPILKVADTLYRSLLLLNAKACRMLPNSL